VDLLAMSSVVTWSEACVLPAVWCGVRRSCWWKLACRGGRAQVFLPWLIGLCCASVLSGERLYLSTVWRPTSQGEKAGAFFGGGNGFHIGGVAVEGDEGKIFFRRCARLHSIVYTLCSCQQSMALKPNLYSMFISLLVCGFETCKLFVKHHVLAVINLTQGYGLLFKKLKPQYLLWFGGKSVPPVPISSHCHMHALSSYHVLDNRRPERMYMCVYLLNSSEHWAACAYNFDRRTYVLTARNGFSHACLDIVLILVMDSWSPQLGSTCKFSAKLSIRLACVVLLYCRHVNIFVI
jgi:hypothetical protein